MEKKNLTDAEAKQLNPDLHFREFCNADINTNATRRDFIFETVLSKALEKLPDNETQGFSMAELKQHCKAVTETALRALYEITFPE